MTCRLVVLLLLFLRTFCWRIKLGGTNLKAYFGSSLPESNYVPRPRQLHSTIIFSTWSQIEMNQLCPTGFCGPLCQSSSSQCVNLIPTPFFNYSENQYAIKNYSISPCDAVECCGGSPSCERIFNANGDLLLKASEEVLLVFGGIELLSSSEEYGEESEQSCYKDFSKFCSQKATNDLFFYFIKRNLWAKVLARPFPGEVTISQPAKRYAHASARVSRNFTDTSGRVYRREYMYIHGGAGPECKGICSDLWVYEVPFAAQKFYPASGDKPWNRGNNWRSIDTKQGPGGRAFHKMIYFEKKNCLYLFGGVDSKESECNDLWEFNVSTETWKEIKTLGVNSINRTLLLWDGYKANFTVGFEDYKPDTDKIVLGEKPFGPCMQSALLVPECRTHFAFEVDRLRREIAYLFGGYKYQNKAEKFFDDLWELNLTTFEWRKIIDTRHRSFTPPSPSPRRGSTITVAYPNLYIFAGVDANVSLADFWAFNINSITWSRLDSQGIFDENSKLSGSKEIFPWPTARHSHTMTNFSEGIIIYGGVELFIPSRLLNTTGGDSVADQKAISSFQSAYKRSCEGLLSELGLNNINRSSFLQRSLLFTKNGSSCLREFPSDEQFFLSSRYPTYPWILSENDACDPSYYPERGRCVMGRMFCKGNWFGNQCENALCENSYCYSETDSLSPAKCVFCSGHGTCSQKGVCTCDKDYTGSDCSIVDCLNNCSTNETMKFGDCIVEYPKSNCRCIDSMKRGGDYCGKTFCLNTCGKDGDSETGLCQENGTCFCYNKELKNYTGPDCSIMGVDLLEYGPRVETFLLSMLALLLVLLI